MRALADTMAVVAMMIFSGVALCALTDTQYDVHALLTSMGTFIIYKQYQAENKS